MHDTFHIAFHQLQGRHMRHRCRQISSSIRITQYIVLTNENECIAPVMICQANEESSSPVQTKATSDTISPSTMTLFILIPQKNRKQDHHTNTRSISPTINERIISHPENGYTARQGALQSTQEEQFMSDAIHLCNETRNTFSQKFAPDCFCRSPSYTCTALLGNSAANGRHKICHYAKQWTVVSPATSALSH